MTVCGGGRGRRGSGDPRYSRSGDRRYVRVEGCPPRIEQDDGGGMWQRSCGDRREKQIPCGNDRKKGKGKNKSKSNSTPIWLCRFPPISR